MVINFTLTLNICVSLSYNLRFPGQYYDAETGKHYNVNRDYDPVTGRYVQSDPIGLDGGMNAFEYAVSSHRTTTYKRFTAYWKTATD